MSGADCVTLGLATHYVASAKVEALKQALLAPNGEVPSILAAARIRPPEPPINALAPDINRLFAANRYEEILAALQDDASGWAAEQLATLARKSNVTCKIVLRQLAESARLTSFADEMRIEYRIASRICRSPDFLEVVRALLIGKDVNPR